MTVWVYFIFGLGIGGLVGWLWASGRLRAAAMKERDELRSSAASAESAATLWKEQLSERDAALAELRRQLDARSQELAHAQIRLEESGKRLDEQRRLLDDAEKRLKETFDALSAKALQSNAEQFLHAAKKTLDVLLADARGDLGKREEAIKGLVGPIAESLQRYETQIQALEQSRQKAYGSLEEQVKLLTSTQQQLQQETGKLASALRDPRVRGRWGEIALRRSAELAGMVEHCDFELQVNVLSDDARFRPDMIVHLPNGRLVVVDAKAVLDAYMDSVAATDDAGRRQHLARHAAQVRARMSELASKGYWDKFGVTPEFVVLFLPGESFFSTAVEVDPTLIEDAIAQRVILASPTTFIALLRAIAYGWRQVHVAENAERISQLGRELFDRIRTFVEHFDRVGVSLGRAVAAYNQATGALDSRVLPSARRFKELGAATGDDIADLAPLDHVPRKLQLPESEV